ncbi:HNH endonuclease [Novosphingobium resinovorum]
MRHHKLIPTIEHITPRSEGGSDDLDNLVLAHRICNQRRAQATRI